ncbi:hypothetical protein GOP47_0023618 [Adiantum capillus-veneris]|uniref:Uncharacterized protein n=1 Tax=Adiantum capillus-veneris TaxID=13818 RepID=A0A9D4U4Z8_ADICA|nr:hypothetical protein GOP47_0023618 [Adiantum capillus-veneris]
MSGRDPSRQSDNSLGKPFKSEASTLIHVRSQKMGSKQTWGVFFFLGAGNIGITSLAPSGWALDSTIDATPFGFNAATSYFVSSSLIAGVVGLASVFGGLHLIKDWREDTNVSANMSSALIAWFLLLLAFGLACKEIHIGGRGTTLQFMEAFVIILVATHGLYVMLLHGRSLIRLPV